MLGAALIEAPPHLKRDGGFVKPGWRPELDEVRQLKDDSRKVLAELEAQYIGETGIKTLKIRHNNILGYFIEVTQQNAKPMLSEPLSDTFRHKQTMANAVRFTARLSCPSIQGRIASAGERALAIELDVFTDLSARVAGQERALSAVSAALAELDHIAALAELAQEQGWVRPQVDASDVFEIRGGRHPVVEQALRQAKGSAFIENDCVSAGRQLPRRQASTKRRTRASGS